MARRLVIGVLILLTSTCAQEQWRGRPPKKGYEPKSKTTKSASTNPTASKTASTTTSKTPTSTVQGNKPSSTTAPTTKAAGTTTKTKPATTTTTTKAAGTKTKSATTTTTTTKAKPATSTAKTTSGSKLKDAESSYEIIKSKYKKGTVGTKATLGSIGSTTYHKETPNSQYKLMYLKGSCPAKVCSGASISDVGAIKGTFLALSDIDALVLHPEWSLAEIRAVQAGIWPANDNIGSCFRSECPTSTMINEIVANNGGTLDALGLAKANPSVDMARLQRALGGQGTKKKAANPTAKKKAKGEL